MLKVTELCKIYSQGEIKVAGLEGFSFTFPDRGMIVVSGESGCGKSTLLNILSGMDTPSSGTIILNDEEITAFMPEEYERYRNERMGYIFQDYNVFDDLS